MSILLQQQEGLRRARVHGQEEAECVHAVVPQRERGFAQGEKWLDEVSRWEMLMGCGQANPDMAMKDILRELGQKWKDLVCCCFRCPCRDCGAGSFGEGEVGGEGEGGPRPFPA
eukprot:753358-Hanusia_phi.AAC.1